jgi:Stress responsive A/B Barrel Domain
VTLQHIVLFSFPRELSDHEAMEMRDMVASWPTQIGLMTRCRLGTDLTGARNRGYAYLLYTEFPDVESMNAYRAHPVHMEFMAWLAERNCTPLAFDYLLDEQTVLMSEPAQTVSMKKAVSPAGTATG